MDAPILLAAHVAFGMLGVLAAIVVFMDLLHFREQAATRIVCLGWVISFGIVVSYLAGGYWYVSFYGADKAIINAGAWPWAHGLVMESKEHLFFMLLLLAFYLPIALRPRRLLQDREQQLLAMTCCGLIVLLGLVMEGTGALIAIGFRMGL